MSSSARTIEARSRFEHSSAVAVEPRLPGTLYLLAGAVFVVLTILGAVLMAVMLRENALTQAQQTIEQVDAARAAQLSQSIQAIDLGLTDIAQRIDAKAESTGVSPASILTGADADRLLITRLRTLKQLAAIFLVDPEGKVVNGTRMPTANDRDASDRDFFTELKRNRHRSFYVSQPIRSRVDGSWIAVMSRPIVQGGEFEGGVMAVLQLERFEHYFADLATIPGCVVTLLRSDGTVLARAPRDEGSIGEPTLPSRNKRALVVTQEIQQGSLRLQMAVSRSTVLAAWRRQAFGIGALALAVTGCIVFMLMVLARQFRAQREFRAALARRNRDLAQASSDLERQTQELEATALALQGGEKLLAERSELLNMTLQYIDQGIMMVDDHGQVAVYNHHVVEMLGLPDDLLPGNPPFTDVLRFQWESGEFDRNGRSFQDFVRAGGILDRPQVYERERPNGRTIEVRSVPLPQGGIVRTYTDVTTRKQAQALIERAALFDELTGLPNRLSLRQSLATRLAEPDGSQRTALLYLNLDRFRLLNDGRGHEAADLLLVEVARRLSASVPADDVVGRVGGDEFAIVHTMDRERDDSSSFGQRLLQCLAAPHVINGIRLAVTASIGIAAASGGADAEMLLRNADIALYRAKDAGRNQLCRYEPAMAVAQEQRFQLEQSLREALGTDAFRLAYQPILALETDEIAGYEALLRWTDRVRGEVSPGLFIPVAEATGLIVPLGRSVLEWACFEAANWPNTRTVAVNLSPAQFKSDDLSETVADILRRSGLAPSRLELEVTEGMLLDNTGPVLETMKALREIGVKLTLDDFGTGHAGLSYLRRFPFQKLKIDRSFVSTLGQNRESDAIVEATLLLGRRLNLGVVAEGVEYPSQLEYLRQLHCPFVQGYLTGRPAPPEVARSL